MAKRSQKNLLRRGGACRGASRRRSDPIEAIFGLFDSQAGSFLVQLDRLVHIRGNACSVLVHPAQVVDAVWIARIGPRAVPANRFRRAGLVDAAALLVHPAKPVHAAKISGAGDFGGMDWL